MRKKHVENCLAVSAIIVTPFVFFCSSDRPEAVVGTVPNWLFADSLHYRDAILNIVSGYVVSVIFYFLVVSLPDHLKKKIHQKHALKVYRSFKIDIIGLIFSASGKCYGTEEIEELMEPSRFREYFKEDETGSGGRWYDFLNGLDDYHRGRIATELEILREELQFLVSHHDIDDSEIYTHLKQVSVAIHAMSKTGVSYDEQKQWGRFLWALFSTFDWSSGYQDEDPIVRSILRI